MLSPEIQRLQAETEEVDPLRVLLDSSALLLSAEQMDDILPRILDLASRVLDADAFAVWREIPEENRWTAIAARGLSERYSMEVRGKGFMPSATWGVSDIENEPQLEHRRADYAAEGLCSMLVVPLELTEAGQGTITFYWRANRNFSERDYAYARALGNFVAAALVQSELKQQNQTEKQRLTFLADASAILASSLDYETTLQKVAEMMVHQIADWCVMHVMENGKPTRLVMMHRDPAQRSIAADAARRFPDQLRDDRGLGRVLATGQTEVLREITPEMIAAGAHDDEHRRMLESLQLTSSILVPMVLHDRVLGAIRLVAAGPANRHFTDADVRLAEDLAHRAASAIENAELHRAVLQKESQLRLSHAAARMGSWHMDLQHNRILWSEEFRALHGLAEADAATYRGGSDLVHPEDRDRVLHELNEAIASGSDHLQLEHRSLTPDGRVLWLQSRGTIQRDPAGKAVAITGVTLDVTESRAQEDALRRTEKLAAAGRLAATVAHEVNNPLEALTNLIFLARNTPGLPDEAKVFLGTAESELDRIAHIVRQTLGFYRDSATPQAIDVGQIAADVTELYGSRAESRMISLTHKAEPGLYAVANVGELKQILANLISNALDATSSGGRVDLRVNSDGDIVHLTVADNGSGISDEHRARLFEPFFTTKNEVGTGLGLWVTKGLVEKHHGTVGVESSTEPGHSGTTFTVSLPRFVPPEQTH